MFPVIVLLVVLILISARHYLLNYVYFSIWQIMSAGAILVLVSGSISMGEALKAIDRDVMISLAGMFVIGAALEESGYLSHLTYRIFRSARSMEALLMRILFVMGLGSAFLMNDTIAIVGTPIVMLLARHHKTNPRPILMALAFAVTLGGVASPLGNPQNLFIATHSGIPNPFVTFARYLLIPTIINLWIAFLFLKKFYKEHFADDRVLTHSQYPVKDHNLALLSKISLVLLVFFIMIKILAAFIAPSLGFGIKLTAIVLAAALPILIFSRRRFDVIRKVDYQTLLFFAGMFILVRAAWDTGFFQDIIYRINSSGSGGGIFSPAMILVVGILASQVVSNVPLVVLYLPLILSACDASDGVKEMMMLAASSTIAGNFSIFGAASNVIIIQTAEKKTKGVSLNGWEFSKIGIPLTALNALVYWVYGVLFWK